MMNCHLEPETELRHESHGLKQVRQQVVQLGMELAPIILRICVVNLRNLAKEVQELRVLKLVHALSVPHCVDHRHETFGEDDTQNLIWHIQL